jgi:hypothetical protein
MELLFRMSSEVFVLHAVIVQIANLVDEVV